MTGAADRPLRRTRARIALLRSAAAGEVLYDATDGEGGSHVLRNQAETRRTGVSTVTARATEQITAGWLRIGPRLPDEPLYQQVEATDDGQRILTAIEEQTRRFLDA